MMLANFLNKVEQIERPVVLLEGRRKISAAEFDAAEALGRLLATRLEPGDQVEFTLDAARHYWLHVARGEVQLDGRKLVTGDALGFVEESGVRTLAGVGDASDVLWFELPQA